MANWFVGLPVDPGAWFARLPPPPHGVRMFSPDDLHLTVAFLGHVGEEAARRAFVHAAAWPVGAVDVTLGEVVPLGNPRRPTALSASLHAGRERVIEGIASLRDAMCDAAGARRDQRPVLPHITLARPGRNASPEHRREAVAWARGLALHEPRVRLDRIVLYTWAVPRRERQFRGVAQHML